MFNKEKATLTSYKESTMGIMKYAVYFKQLYFFSYGPTICPGSTMKS